MPYLVKELVGQVSTDGYEIDVWRVDDPTGATMFVPHLVPTRDGLDKIRLTPNIVIPDHVTTFPDTTTAIKQALEMRKKLLGKVAIQGPDLGDPDLIPGYCSKCRIVGNVLFQVPDEKQGDKVLNQKPIQAFCQACKQECEFVPLGRGVSPYLDKKMDEWRALRDRGAA